MAKDRGGPPIPPIAPCTGITTNQNNVNGISRNHHRRPATIHRSFLTRREFLRNSAVLAAGLAIPQTNARKTEIIARPLLLTWFPHFVDTLPIPQVIKPTGGRPSIGPTVAPFANELGWKDTVQVPPCTVTRIITKFGGYAGRYVWHCHLLEHEDNEMMRPYDIVSA